jgi:hypothetical protein
MNYKSKRIVTFLTISNLFNASNHQEAVYNEDYMFKKYWLYQKRLLYFGVMINF